MKLFRSDRLSVLVGAIVKEKERHLATQRAQEVLARVMVDPSRQLKHILDFSLPAASIAIQNNHHGQPR